MYEYYVADFHVALYCVVGTSYAFESFEDMVAHCGSDCQLVETPDYCYDEDCNVW